MTDPYRNAADLLAQANTASLVAGVGGRVGDWTPPEPAALQGLAPNLTVETLIGHGGMGAVYRAKQISLDRVVALKVLRPELAADPGFAARFARESRALARLSHPNIVTVHDSGTTNGTSWMVLEFIEGATLREVLRSGRMSAAEALRLAPQLCAALQYAHDLGVVHRDLKPENILLDESGRARIADFGLAKLQESGQDVGITRSGQVLGTMHYIAPEQLAGDPKADHRADIYALGVIIYEMLTGQLPVGRFEPPSRRIAVDLRMDEVVLRSLEREPDRRWQRVDQVAEAMAGIASSARPAVPPPAQAPPSTPAAADTPAVPADWWTRIQRAAHQLERPHEHRLLGGVCAGLGKHTLLPLWVWRMFVLILLFAGLRSPTGAGVVLVYAALWISIPSAKRGAHSAG